VPDDGRNKALEIWFTSVAVCPDIGQGLNSVQVEGESRVGGPRERLFRKRPWSLSGNSLEVEHQR
jgi:hypothetical protein